MYAVMIPMIGEHTASVSSVTDDEHTNRCNQSIVDGVTNMKKEII